MFLLLSVIFCQPQLAVLLLLLLLTIHIVFDHKACLFSSLLIYSSTLRDDIKYFVRVFCCLSCLDIDTHGKWKPQHPENHWKDSPHPFHKKVQHLEICLLEDFINLLSPSHLLEFTVTLVDKFPRSSKLRTGKSTTPSVSDRTRHFQSSFVISDLRFFLAWMLLRQTNMFVDKDYIVIQLSILKHVL